MALKITKCKYYRWVITNSEYVVDDPSFLCERCLRNTHYADTNETDSEQNEDNSLKKLFDFKAYHFSQL